MTGCMDMKQNGISQQSMLYESRRCIGIKDSIRGRNTFPHLIKYPKDYWPVPPGFACMKLIFDNLNVWA